MEMELKNKICGFILEIIFCTAKNFALILRFQLPLHCSSFSEPNFLQDLLFFLKIAATSDKKVGNNSFF